MDSYYLSKDEWDTIVEIGVGDQSGEIVNKKISGATKSALTRKYVVFIVLLALENANIMMPGTICRSILLLSTKHWISG